MYCLFLMTHKPTQTSLVNINIYLSTLLTKSAFTLARSMYIVCNLSLAIIWWHGEAVMPGGYPQVVVTFYQGNSIEIEFPWFYQDCYKDHQDFNWLLQTLMGGMSICAYDIELNIVLAVTNTLFISDYFISCFWSVKHNIISSNAQ